MVRFKETYSALNDASPIWSAVFENHFGFEGAQDMRCYYQNLFEEFVNSEYFSEDMITAEEPDIISNEEIDDFIENDFFTDDPVETYFEEDDEFVDLIEGFESFLKKKSKYAAKAFNQLLRGDYPEGGLYFDQSNNGAEPNFETLSQDNQDGVRMLRLEIHDREKYDCSPTSFSFIVIHLKLTADYLSQNGIGADQYDWWAETPDQFKKFSSREVGLDSPEDFRNLFRAGLTDYQNMFLDYIKDPDLRASILVSLEHSVKVEEDSETMDDRISFQMTKVKWYLDEYQMPASYQDVVFRFLLKMELDYRDKTRKKELSQSDPTRREAHFSHFLRVLRIGLGLVDAVRKRQYRLKPPLADMFDDLFVDDAKTQINHDGLLIYCFELLTHDLEEDGHLTGVNSEADTKRYVGEVLPKTLKLRDQLLEAVAFTASGLNDDRFGNDRVAYVTNAVENPRLRRVKLPDMIQNFSSPYTDKAEKIKVYGDIFLKPFEEAGLYHVTPNRLFVSGLAQNEVLVAASETWRRIFAVIASEHQEQDMEALARTLGINLAQDYS